MYRRLVLHVGPVLRAAAAMENVRRMEETVSLWTKKRIPNKSRINGLVAFAAILSLMAAPAGLRATDVDAQVVPRTASPPVIDGKLDEAVWSSALKFQEFKTFQPDYGKDPSQKTECLVSYDAENFYFGVRCYDTEPGKVKAAVSKRDAIMQDDIIGIILDTFNDMQSGFTFILNPLGIQADGIMNVAGNIDDSLDMVWYSKGQIDDRGWTVEARVPLQSIRFPSRETLTMRVLFFRFLTRTSEQMSYPPLDPDGGSILGQSQTIEVSDLKYKRVIELLPAFTTGVYHAAEGGEFVKDQELSSTDLSLTGKFGIASDLVLDGTVNPDFSQVEADAGQVDVNLRYALYYPEKRPFFLEGNEIWRFGGEMEDAPVAALVYTRKIVDPVFGFKLTGKLSRRGTVATIYAMDNLLGEEVPRHPHFVIGRYRHSMKEDSYLGGFYTSREYSGGFNRVGGVDGRLRLSKTSVASFHLLGSLTRDGAENPTDRGHALSAYYNYQNRKWYIDLGYQDVSKDFQVDTGFVLRTGVRRIAAFGMYQIYPESKFFQKIEPFYWSYHLYDTWDSMWETTNVFVLRMWLPRNTQVRFEGLLANEVFSGERFSRNGYGFRSESQILKQLFVNVFYRRMGSIYYDPDAPYQGYGSRIQGGARFQPTENLDFSLSLSYVDFYRRSDREKIYDYTIFRNRNTFQVNKYLFLRAILEYNFFRKRLTADLLASFTYIPGTVVHFGYGSAFERLEWDGQDYIAADRFLQMQRGFFFKVSYLWRI